MADGIVQVAPDSTGKKVDTSELTVSGNVVERQRINLADPAAAAAIAAVKNASPVGSDYGVVVREANLGQQTMANSVAVTLASDQSALKVDTESAKATYTAQMGISPTSAATDIVTITGSPSKTVRIKRIYIMGTAAAAGTGGFVISRRSSANSGGTTVTVNPRPHDINDPAPTATITAYTANATSLGTITGNVFQGVIALYPATTGAPLDRLVLDYSTRNGKGLVLRGSSDILSINGNGNTFPSSTTLYINIEFTEE